jgi:hypothetical protein
MRFPLTLDHATSGHYKDDEVAELIGAVEGPHYTTEAHVQWRHRDTAEDLLRGPSTDVMDLLDEMDRELAD